MEINIAQFMHRKCSHKLIKYHKRQEHNTSFHKLRRILNLTRPSHYRNFDKNDAGVIKYIHKLIIYYFSVFINTTIIFNT